MVKLLHSPFLVAATLATLTAAHPGEHEHNDDPEVIAWQARHATNIKRGLAACEGNPDFIAIQKRAMERRAEKARSLREKRGIDQERPYKLRRRDQAALETFAAVNHNLTGQGYSLSSSSSDLFTSYSNSSCILTPEVTYGPYYVSGEYYRSNVAEDQEGVPVHIEYQYIDVNTCKVPTSTLYIETWSTNSTGVYAGVVASGNGNANDASNLNNTFQRGVTKVNSDGVGAFDVLFPGHYTGRTTHTHLMTHIDGTVYANNTFTSTNIAHVGQLFYDDDLITAVEATSPYNTNTQTRTYNADDSIAQSASDNSYDPFPDWTMLGDDVSDGLLMWISIGIDLTASYTASPAATLTENGGVANSNSMGGGSGGGSSISNGTMSGGSPPNGTAGGAAPSGAMPSGATPSGAGASGASPNGTGVASGSVSGTATSTTATGTSRATTSKTSSPSSVAVAATSTSLAVSTSVGTSSKSSQRASSSTKKESTKQASTTKTAAGSTTKTNNTATSTNKISGGKSSSTTKSITGAVKPSTVTKSTATKKSTTTKKATATKNATTTKKSTTTRVKSTTTRKASATKLSTKVRSSASSKPSSAVKLDAANMAFPGNAGSQDPSNRGSAPASRGGEGQENAPPAGRY